ncbi:MAG: hypothetical protein NTV00_02695 [Methylococcales bacterium]|nr:hypothetical protein [Methylococcales bacterium]
MTELTLVLDGQQLAKLCKNSLPSSGDELLLEKLQALAPDFRVHLARTGHEWYRIGGIVDTQGKRISSDLIEWTERTYIECGKNLQTLIEHAREQNLIATRQIGNTLYFVIQTGKNAENFIQIDIDKTNEIADRLLVSDSYPPEDLEEFIDPLDPHGIEAFSIGTARYVYRRKTDVKVFMQEVQKHAQALSGNQDEHPVQRFMDDWNNSSAGLNAAMSDDWIIRPYRHTGRFGEQIMNVELINTQTKNLPELATSDRIKGTALQHVLARFDRQVGYPFAWFFYMLKGKLVSPQSGAAVFKDISKEFAYLPERDAAVLKNWAKSPYNV